MNAPLQTEVQNKPAARTARAAASPGPAADFSASVSSAWCKAAVSHDETQSVSGSASKTRYTLFRPLPRHRFDRASILPASKAAPPAMASSPPQGGVPLLRSQAEGGGEEGEMLVEPIQVMFTSVTGAPIFKRQTAQIFPNSRRPQGTSTPDGGATATVEGGGSAGSGSTSGGAPAQGACVRSLDMRSSGAIEGKYGISDYWPGVTAYWGADKTLGQFDEASSGGWRLFGHKFQVIGRFDRVPMTGAGGDATFQQEARLTTGTAPPGTAGSWFDDMDYVDDGGGAHHWDPNAEAGTTVRSGYPGVRRTLASNTYAYTDPPAIGYQPGTTNTYRKLEFKIWFRSTPGCACPSGILAIGLPRVQEIQVTNGTPTVLKYPYP